MHSNGNRLVGFCVECVVEEGLAHDVDEEVKRIQTRADFLQTAYLKCKSFAESESRNLSMSSYENKGNSFSATTFSAEMGSGIQKPREQEQIQQKVSKGLKILGSELEQIYTHLKAGIQTGSFQWIDSKLIKVVTMSYLTLVSFQGLVTHTYVQGCASI